MGVPARIAALTAIIVLGGCASTRIDITGSALKEPLCQVGSSPVATVIFWGTQWRPDQKEPQHREAAALKGIQDFVAQTPCLAVSDIRRVPSGSPVPTDQDLIRSVSTPSGGPERVVLVMVHELGPHLSFGIPVIVEGGTEAIIDVRVLQTHTFAVLASTRIEWRNGGRFIVKGVRSLDEDMRAALHAALMPGVATR